jgi:hypothetical protein
MATFCCGEKCRRSRDFDPFWAASRESSFAWRYANDREGKFQFRLRQDSLSIDEFCVDEGVSRSTFYRWVERLKAGIPEAVKEEGASLTLAEMAEPKFLPISVTASPVEIELPNGGLVRLPVGVGQAVIVDVIQAVTGLQTRRKPQS